MKDFAVSLQSFEKMSKEHSRVNVQLTKEIEQSLDTSFISKKKKSASIELENSAQYNDISYANEVQDFMSNMAGISRKEEEQDPFDQKLAEKYSFDANYLEKNHPELNWSMRAILIDWMIEVCNDFGMKRETLYCAVDYVDRYLSKQINISKDKLQCIGISSLYLSAKKEVKYSCT